MEKEITCNSCGKHLANVKGSVIFPCPDCNKFDIVRCFYCRRLAARYTCHNCEFSGPN